MNKKVTLKAFEEVASKNGYEVFTPEEIASYYKEGLAKSINCQMASTEKEEFASDIIGLQKAVVSDENGKETVRYYRKKQVEWETSQDGTILKGIEGIYLDTPENRRLKRVGQPYIASEEIVKSICEADENIMKAVRTGRYADTSENRRLHRVGQPYKTRDKKVDEVENKGSEKGSKKTNYSKMNLEEAKKELVGKTLSVKDVEDGKVRTGKIEEIVEGNVRGHSVLMAKVSGAGVYPIKHIGAKEPFKAWKLDIVSGGEKEDKKPEQKTEENKANIDDMLNIHKTFRKEDLKGLDDSSLNKLKEELQKKYDEAWEIDSRAIGRRGYSTINSNSSEYRDRLFYVKNEIKKRGESKKKEPKPEEKKETKPEKKETPKSEDTQEEKYTRVKFDDLPDSGKVNLKKYLTTKRKSAVDNKLSDISKMDTSELKKMEKEAVEKFNKDFGESKKSQRAEDLYYIMKIKAELSKRK